MENFQTTADRVVGSQMYLKKNTDVYSYVNEDGTGGNKIMTYPKGQTIGTVSGWLDKNGKLWWFFSEFENPGLKALFGKSTIYIEHNPNNIHVNQSDLYTLPSKPELSLEEKIVKYGIYAGIFFASIKLLTAYIQRPKTK